jgi:hypothetical protein
MVRRKWEDKTVNNQPLKLTRGCAGRGDDIKMDCRQQTMDEG